MGDEPTHDIVVKIADTPEEKEQALKLRYVMFYEHSKAVPDEKTLERQMDEDRFDEIADHLIVTDRNRTENQIIGTYRLMRRESVEKAGGFYSSTEYDISKLLDQDATLLELGRSCVLPEYRTRMVMYLLWQGISDYIASQKIDMLFGCASFESTDLEKNAESLSYLHHYHLAPPELRSRTLDKYYVDMNIMPKEEINPRRAFLNLPALIKGYLRLGGVVGDGAFFDHQLDTTDIFILVRFADIEEKYKKHYARGRDLRNAKSESVTEIMSARGNEIKTACKIAS